MKNRGYQNEYSDPHMAEEDLYSLTLVLGSGHPFTAAFLS